MEIHGLLHKAELSMQDIGKVEIGKKDAMILYDKAGRKLITADGLTENYDRLQSSLKANGKNAVKPKYISPDTSHSSRCAQIVRLK